MFISQFSPVIVTTLNRHCHFARLMESLKTNKWAKYTDVFIGLDYPPSNQYQEGWKKTCEFLEKEDFSIFHNITIIKRNRNYGFENNVEDILSQIEKKYDRYIVLEDDLELSPNYLEYMNKCLHEYKDDPQVVAVAGYSYPINWDISEGATCLKQNINAAAWGRGGWFKKRALAKGAISSGKMLKELPDVIRTGAYKKMIDVSLMEYIPAALSPSRKLHKFMYMVCDISMRAYLAVYDKYVISPVISKVRNFGFDGSGVYCQDIQQRDNLTALSYDYGNQPIDMNATFDLILDKKNSDEENRERLNSFDSRTSKQLNEVRKYMWIIQRYGIFTAKVYAYIYLPIKIGKKIIIKLTNVINKQLK